MTAFNQDGTVRLTPIPDFCTKCGARFCDGDCDDEEDTEVSDEEWQRK